MHTLHATGSGLCPPKYADSILLGIKLRLWCGCLFVAKQCWGRVG